MALRVPFVLNTQHLAAFHPRATIRNGRFRSFHLTTKPSRITLQACLPSNSESTVTFRPLANFPSDIWNKYFTSMPLDVSKFESDSIQTEVLKEEVKKMLTTCKNPVEKINLIDSLCRLGVSYHFESEIEQGLDQILYGHPHLLEESDYDLYTVGLVFRVFRQHGYKISDEVLSKFMESDGKFKECLISDTKGMLSLYEACHVRMHGEVIMEEALAFTKAHLKTLAASPSTSRSHLCRHINDALKHPLHRDVPRLQARKYITFYETDENKNETLLKFAKFDYNRVQFLHLQELHHVLKWWNDLDLMEELSYARNRMVETYFWMVSMHFEPHWAKSRMLLIEASVLFTLIDDTYDGYGTYEEVQCLTEAIERWDYGAIDQLPRYMRKLYKAMLDAFSEFDNDETLKGRHYTICYSKEEVKKLVRAYQKERDWLREDYVPSMEEYLSNEIITAGVILLSSISFMGMGEIAGKKEYEWLLENPKICRGSSIIARLENDIASHEAEQKRGRHIPSTVECYMKEYGVSKEEAIQELQKMIENAWKDMNEACMRPTHVPRALLNVPFNIARFIEAMYKYGDGYSYPKQLEELIAEMFAERITF